MRELTPEEKIAADWGKKVDKCGFDSLTPVKVTPAPEPQPSSPEEAAEWQAASQYERDVLAEGYKQLREEAEEALIANPRDDAARAKLLRAQQWEKNHAKGKDPKALVIRKKGRSMTLSTRKIGVWVRSGTYGWLLKVSPRGCVVGDCVDVRTRGGVTERM
jgi:hypothetical protein